MALCKVSANATMAVCMYYNDDLHRSASEEARGERERASRRVLYGNAWRRQTAATISSAAQSEPLDEFCAGEDDVCTLLFTISNTEYWAEMHLAKVVRLSNVKT